MPDLRARGITFENYDMTGEKSASGVVTDQLPFHSRHAQRRTCSDLHDAVGDVQEGRLAGKQAQRRATLLRGRLQRAPQARAK